VSQAVNDLLHANLVEEIFCVPDIVNPLSVSTGSSGKQKLTLDLRHVNSFIFKQKFKHEDLGVAIQIFDKGFHLIFKFNLMSGFRHIEFFTRIKVSYVSALRPSVWAVFSPFRIY